MNKFRSNAERRIAEWLDKNGVKYTYEGEKLPYTSPIRKGLCTECKGKKVVQQRTYLPDFFIHETGVYIEVKGRLTSTDRTKMLDIKRAHPDKKIVLVLLADNKIRKNSDKRYSQWCAEHDFPFEIKTIKTKWIYNKK